MLPSGSPHKDADRYDRIQQAWLDSRPQCSCCGEPIQESAFYVVHGKKFCVDCQEHAWEELKADYLEVVKDG